MKLKANPAVHTMAAPHDLPANVTGFGVNRQLAVVRVERTNKMSEGGSCTEYTYGGYACSRVVGRQACKFAWIETRDVTLSKTKRTEYYHQFPLAGLVRAEHIIHNINKTLETYAKGYSF